MDARKCCLTARQHLALNAVLETVILCTVTVASTSKSWFYYRHSEYSLFGMKNDYSGHWMRFSDFQPLCTQYNLDRYSDLADNCEEFRSFEMAGFIVSV